MFYNKDIYERRLKLVKNEEKWFADKNIADFWWWEMKPVCWEIFARVSFIVVSKQNNLRLNGFKWDRVISFITTVWVYLRWDETVYKFHTKIPFHSTVCYDFDP